MGFVIFSRILQVTFWVCRVLWGAGFAGFMGAFRVCGFMGIFRV